MDTVQIEVTKKQLCILYEALDAYSEYCAEQDAANALALTVLQMRNNFERTVAEQR